MALDAGTTSNRAILFAAIGITNHRFFDDSGVLNISLVDFLQDSTGAI